MGWAGKDYSVSCDIRSGIFLKIFAIVLKTYPSTGNALDRFLTDFFQFTDSDLLDWPSPSTEGLENQQMMVDEDYMDLMSDTLFSTITSNQPFAFPDIREIGQCLN